MPASSVSFSLSPLHRLLSFAWHPCQTMPSKESESVLTRFTAAVKSSSRPVSHARDSVYTSVGFKSVSTTQIKAQHSRTSVSPFYSIWCSVCWQTADRATCLPPSRHNPIPSTTVPILESCRRCPLSAAEMIAPLSGCDLFMLPIKLIRPHIVVNAWHWKMEDDTSSDYMAQWLHRLARVLLHRSPVLWEREGVGEMLYCATIWLSCNVSGLSAHAICTCPASSVLNWLRFIVKDD